jgi:hypothetical protein
MTAPLVARLAVNEGLGVYFGFDVGGIHAAMTDLLGADVNGNGEKVAVRSRCRFLLPLIHSIPDSLAYSVPVF